MVQNIWMTRSLLRWYLSSILPPIVKNVVQIICSTTSLVQAGGTWKAPSKCGLDYRVEAAPKIRVPGIGMMQWMTSLAIGTGPSLFALVCTFTLNV